MDADELEKDDLQDYADGDGSNTMRWTQCHPHAEKIDDALDDSDDENGASTQERTDVLSALMLSAGTIADAAQQSWTNAVRHGRVDLAEVCCTTDSQLAGEVIIKVGPGIDSPAGMDMT